MWFEATPDRCHLYEGRIGVGTKRLEVAVQESRLCSSAVQFLQPRAVQSPPEIVILLYLLRSAFRDTDRLAYSCSTAHFDSLICTVQCVPIAPKLGKCR